MYQYLSRLTTTLLSRRDIGIEQLTTERSDFRGKLAGRLRFYDGSCLIFAERIIRTDNRITKLEYRYHYQRDDGTLIFRYDSSPHYPNLATHPHHKHVGDQVIAARPPDLSDVLREIDALIYPQST